DFVRDLVVRGVAPPGQDVGLGERGLGQTVLRLVERCDTYVHGVAQPAADAFGDRRVHAVGIDLPNRRLAPLMDVLVPDRDAQLATSQHQIGSASPVR